MSNLPEWIHNAFGRSFECSDGERLEQALAIAWEALDKTQLLLRCERIPGTVPMCETLQDAMRRIEELGK